VDNRNPFAVSGSLVLRRTISTDGQIKLIELATATLKLAPLGSAVPTIVISPRYRALLAGLGSLTAYLQLHVRGPAGPAVTINERLKLYAPSAP
jgi:hypothetical protein